MYTNHEHLRSNNLKIKLERLTGRPTISKYKKFQDLLNSVGLILNSIRGHSTVLCLNKEIVG